MSYTVEITNQSTFELTTGSGAKIPAKGSWKSEVLGHDYVEIPMRGPLSFQDVAEKRVGGDTDQTWGVLISYQGEEVIGRYEGGGELRIEINELLQATLTNMSLRQVSLRGLELG